MDKVQVDENIKELLTSNLDSIMAMEKNSPEIYNAFSKLLSAIDTKYGSGNGVKNLQYFAPTTSTNPNAILISAIRIRYRNWNKQLRSLYIYNWWQFQRAFEFLLEYTDNPTLEVELQWENNTAYIQGEIDVQTYLKTTAHHFIGDGFKTILGSGYSAWFNRTSDKSLYINYLENLDFNSGFAVPKQLDVLVDGRSFNWLQAQTYILNHYHSNMNTSVAVGVVFDRNYPSYNYANINLDYSSFLADNNLTPAISNLPIIPYKAFIGYIALDTITYGLDFKKIALNIPDITKIINNESLITVETLFDYDWGKGELIWEEIGSQNRKLLEWHISQIVQPSTAQTTQQVTLKRGTPITSASSQKQTQSLTIQDYVKTADWTPKWKSQGYRPSPTRSASTEKNNALGVGNDGQLYLIARDKNGVKRWAKSKILTIEDIVPTAITDKDDLLRAVAILEDMLVASKGAWDNDEVQAMKDQQANYIMEYNKR